MDLESDSASDLESRSGLASDSGLESAPDLARDSDSVRDSASGSVPDLVSEPVPGSESRSAMATVFDSASESQAT